MKKKILIAALICVLLIFSAGVWYLNQSFLPAKISSLITDSLREATGRPAAIDSVSFNIFRGIVLRGVHIGDAPRQLLDLEEASCQIVVPALLAKKVVIRLLVFKHAKIYLERSAGGGTVQDIMSRQRPGAHQGPAARRQPAALSVAILKARIIDSTVYFRDTAVSPVFETRLEHCDITARIFLPERAVFTMRGVVAGSAPVEIEGKGDYRIARKEGKASFSAHGIRPDLFAPYYSPYSVTVPRGIVDLDVNVTAHEDSVTGEVNFKSHDVVADYKDISAAITGDVSARIDYRIPERTLGWTGSAGFTDTSVSGLQGVGRIGNITGRVVFDEKGLAAQEIRGVVLGMPVTAGVTIENLTGAPRATGTVYARSDLAAAAKAAAGMNVVLPVALNGTGAVSVAFDSFLPVDGRLKLKGALDVQDAGCVFPNSTEGLAGVNGRFMFDGHSVQWQGVTFLFRDTAYAVSGSLTNFYAPQVNAVLTSPDVKVSTAFSVSNTTVEVSLLDAQYRSSTLALQGSVSRKDMSARVSGKGRISVTDVLGFLNQTAATEGIKPSGIIDVAFDGAGPAGDTTSWTSQGSMSSGEISVYGLKMRNITADLAQENGMVKVRQLRADMYNGTLALTSDIGLSQDGLPCNVGLRLQDVRIEELKSDTKAKDKDISGVLYGRLDLAGRARDLNSIKGAGSILVKEGKLGELNLLKGIGALIFPKDFFSKIVFTEGSCSFIVKDKFVSTDDLLLKSNVTNLAGALRIGFDQSIDGTVDVDILQGTPLNGSVKDILSGIVGQAGRFGVIRIKGTLQEPKFNFKPAEAVKDMIKGIGSTLKGILTGG